MSWLSDFLSALKPSSREEHFWAKIAGEEELENEYIPSSREEGFRYKIAQKIAELSEGGGSGGGSFVVGGTVSGTTVTLDKTVGEIFAAMKKQNVIVVLEQPMEGLEEMILTFFMADAAPVGDTIYYTFLVAGGMQTVAATADAYPRMSLA